MAGLGFGTSWGSNAKSYKIYEEDKKRRETNPSFRDFHPVQYTPGFQSTSKKQGSKSYSWEKDYLYDLPKSYGKSYNDKFDKVMDEIGVPASERDDFRKYLDAKEKGKLGDSEIGNIVNDFKFRVGSEVKIPGARYTGTDEKKKHDGDRSLLDRTFDGLLIGNYASAGFADGVFNEGSLDKGLDQAWEGIKAGNPFGRGNERGEMTYSKVLENAGWKPTSTGGRIGKGTAGFALDVLLDPTTYLTAGVGAILKGTGRVGQVAGKFGPGVVEALDLGRAKQIVETMNMKRGLKMGSEEVSRDAERLVKKYNELRGIREAKPVTVGLGNAPFGDKIFGKKLGRTFEIGNNKALQTVGDLTLAKPYAIVRDKILASKVGQKLSPKHPAYMLAKEDPAALADFLKMTEITRGLHADKLAGEKEIRKYVAEKLSKFSPDEQKKMVELLQDKTIMADVKRMVKFGETDEAKRFAQVLTQRKDLAAAKLKTLLDDHNTLQHLKSGYEDGIIDMKDELDVMKFDLDEQLKQIDLNDIDDEKLYGQAVDLIRTRSKELEEQFTGLSSPVKPKLKMPDEPVEPKRPYLKRPRPPELEQMPDLKVEDELASGLDGLNKSIVERWNKSDKGAEAKVKTIDELSQIIFGETGRISRATYPREVDELIDSLNQGAPIEELKWMIDQKPHMFDGRATDIDRFVADKFGYGSGREYKNWEEFYDKRMQPITKKLEKGEKITQQEKKLVENLEKIRAERARDRAFMKDMNKEELMEYMRKQNEIKMLRDFDSVAGSAYNAGSYDVVKDDVTGELRAVIRDKDARKSSDEFMDERRNRFYDEDRATASRRTGEFDDTLEVDRKLSLTNDEFDEIKGSVLADVARDGKISKAHMKYATSVVDEIEPILKDVFKKPYDKLTEKQKKFAISLAKQNAFNKGTGKNAQSDIVAKKALEVAEKRMKADLVKAVEKRAQTGSTVFFKGEGGKVKGGEIIAVERDANDFLQYRIMGHNGKEITVVPEKITRVEKMTPQDILLKELSEETPSATKKLADEMVSTNARNIEREMDYQDELAQYEKTKADAKAKYEQDISEFHAKHQEWVENKELLEKLHQADLKAWKGAVIKSSESAKQLFNQRQLLRAELDMLDEAKALKPMRQDMKKQDIIRAFDEQEQTLVENMKNLEMSVGQLEKLMMDDKFDGFDKYLDKIANIENALASDDALETLYRTHFGNRKADEAVHAAEGVPTGLKVLDTRNDIDDNMKEVVKELRKTFNDIGRKEFKYGKLSQGQLNAWFDEYVPHIPTPEGAGLFKNKKITTDADGNVILEDKLLNEKGLALTQDFGYGRVFNPHSLSRTIKKLKMPDGTWVQKPTIEQINEVMSPILKGKNAFSESIADIYLARMLKHNDLVYDQEYMHKMMDIFGDELKPGQGVKNGFVAVANFGLVQKKIKDVVGARYMQMQLTGQRASREEIRAQVLRQMGFTEKMLDDLATPMLELSEAQIRGLHGIDPTLVKQVNGAIAQKANQARKLQIEKDQSKFLQLYDKFTHLMKLNQTTIMPAFHARNAWSNMYLNYLAIGRDAVNPKFKRQAWRAARFEGNPEKLADLPTVNIGGEEKTWSELYDMAKSHQVIDEGFFAKDMGAEAATGGIKGGKFDPTDSENFFAYRMGGTWGNRIENHDRLIHFVSQLKNGKTVEEARESVEKYLFDYSDLTAFEQSVMKRIFPYYTWLRKNGALQLDQAIENPGRMRDAAKGVNMVEGGTNEEDKLERRYMSDFAKDWAQTPFRVGVGDGKEEPVLWNPNLPFMDLARMPDPTRPVDSLITAFTQTVPQIKVPVEQVLNKNFFFDDRIVEKDATLKEAAITRAMHAGSQFAGFTAGEGLVNKQGLDRGLHAANLLTGQKFLSYDYDTSKQMTIAKEKGQFMDDEVPVDKFIRKMRNPVSFISKDARQAYKEETNHITQSLDNWINGDATEEDKAEYAPLIKMLHETANKFGVDEARQKRFTRTVLEQTDWDSVLLGKDFTKGKVVEVLDGDTFKVDFPGVGKPKKVRMLYVDTPETVDPDMDIEMPFGKDASNYTKSMLEGGDVQLVIDTRQKDAHGRLLAYVYHNGRDVNNDVLDEGLGKVRYTGFSDEQYKVDAYRSTQQKSKDAKRGIWSIDGYTSTDDTGYDEAIARKYGKKRK